MLPCGRLTKSGMNLRMWLGLVIAANQEEGRIDGPAFCDQQGFVLSAQVLDNHLHDALCQLWEADPSNFPHDIQTVMEIKIRYHCFRSLRRSSDTQATNQKVSRGHIEVVNRWSKDERAGAKQASLLMHQHYAQIEELWPSFKAYTKEM